MKIVVAPDSFKECLSAQQVAQAMSCAIPEMYPEADVTAIPLADGGEGTLDVLAGPMGAHIETVYVSDPFGRRVNARYGISGETAIIEVAEACGLQLLSKTERNPMLASSRGVGELIIDACGKGCRHFIIGLGGTATCDGGMGMMSVPGLPEVLSKCEVELLCDVKAPFVGPQGAAKVFAPQKGATPEEVELLEESMLRMAADIKEQTGVDISFMPCAGAAGGIAGALMAYANARVCAGVERVMELYGFSEAIQEADLIITGEGKSDSQTLMGKVPFGVLKHAAGKPVALLSGRIEDKAALKRAGFIAMEEVSPRNLPLDKAMDPATALQNIHNAVLNLMANSYICI